MLSNAVVQAAELQADRGKWHGVIEILVSALLALLRIRPLLLCLLALLLLILRASLMLALLLRLLTLRPPAKQLHYTRKAINNNLSCVLILAALVLPFARL
mgnify:CR=1 FL=1